MAFFNRKERVQKVSTTNRAMTPYASRTERKARGNYTKIEKPPIQPGLDTRAAPDAARRER
jgi:hypothetical protein